ncbi:MAG: sulfurtransferase TusA family protein [Clostridia bacterium]|nr:sulfurtransferase TusA family protein [Clostridia bacterium]
MYSSSFIHPFSASIIGLTLLDLREPDEVLASGIDGAINLPFSGGFGKLDTVPKNKPVVVFCRVGDWSEQVAEILADRGYDTYTLDGGYNAYRKLLAGRDRAAEEAKTFDAKSDKQPSSVKGTAENIVLIDAKGLKCPGPIVKVADYLRDKPVGETIRVESTEDAFASDIRVWCDRTGNIYRFLHRFDDGSAPRT